MPLEEFLMQRGGEQLTPGVRGLLSYRAACGQRCSPLQMIPTTTAERQKRSKPTGALTLQSQTSGGARWRRGKSAAARGAASCPVACQPPCSPSLVPAHSS